MTLVNVMLNGNYNTDRGVGLCHYAGTATLTNVAIINNTSGSGGSFGSGLYVHAGAALLTNVTLSGNHADAFGGGVYTDGGTTTLINNTLYGNSAASDGGISVSGGTVMLTNTIVANNTGGDCGGIIGGSFNLSSDNNCGFGVRGNINVMLGPLADNGGSTLTHMPLPGSPAIDFGTNVGCPSTDQRGFRRPIGIRCDVGAVEYQLRTSLPFIKK